MKIIRKFIIKWLYGHCRHICTLCPYRKFCRFLVDEWIINHPSRQKPIKRDKWEILNTGNPLHPLIMHNSCGYIGMLSKEDSNFCPRCGHPMK